MQAHLLKTRSYWFQAPPMRLFASSFRLLCLSFLSLLCYDQPCPAFFSFTYSIPVVLPSPSLHLRVVRRDGVHFCYLIFIVESFAASLSGVKFTPVAVRGRKLTRALKTTSKNDYSEINNNDITARHDRYARKWFSSVDLDSLGV